MHCLIPPVGEDDLHYALVKPEPVHPSETEMTPQQLKSCSDVSHPSLAVQTNTEVWFHEEDMKAQTYQDKMKQLTSSPVSGVCDGPLQESIQIKEEEDDSYHVAVKPEPITVETSELMGSLGYNLLTICPPLESNIKTEIEREEAQYTKRI